MVPEEHVWKLPYLLLFFPRHLEDSFPVLQTFIFLYLDDIFCVSDVERTDKVSLTCVLMYPDRLAVQDIEAEEKLYIIISSEPKNHPS